jgi:CDP-diacylglycerol---glycerol-3-phosphate 3-phosphatidyltransferase
MIIGYLPTIVSSLRGLLVLPYVYTDSVMLKIIIVFTAILTDILDGYLARKFAVCSDFGEMLDPIMDKFFILSVSYSLWFDLMVPTTVFVGLIIREVILFSFAPLYFIFKKSMRFQHTPLMIGKLYTFFQFVSVIYILYGYEIPLWWVVSLISVGVLVGLSYINRVLR